MRQNIYDNKIFSDEYDTMRKEKKGTSANDVIEIPIFRKMLPDVKNKTVLDLGCGYGENVRYCKELGASYVLGTDISNHMIEMANKENKVPGVEYQVIAMEDLKKINKKFDIVISSLAFHYVKNFNKLLKDINKKLNKNGILLFSQEHPIFDSLKSRKHFEKNHFELYGKRYNIVSDYNRIGKRITKWNDCDVIKYHRNFQTIINTLIRNGFIIDEMNECEPNKEMINKNRKYINQYEAPYFLFIKAHKK